MCTRAQSFQTNIIVQSPTIVCFHHENKTYAIHRQQGDTFGFDAKVPYIYAFLACWEFQSRSRKGKVVWRMTRSILSGRGTPLDGSSLPLVLTLTLQSFPDLCHILRNFHYLGSLFIKIFPWDSKSARKLLLIKCLLIIFIVQCYKVVRWSI